MIMTESSSDRRINTDDDCYDLIYWSIKFGISVEQLIEAVAQAGPRVFDVERHLNRRTVTADPSAPNAYATGVSVGGAISLQDWRFRTRRFG